MIAFSTTQSIEQETGRKEWRGEKQMRESQKHTLANIHASLTFNQFKYWLIVPLGYIAGMVMGVCNYTIFRGRETAELSNGLTTLIQTC